MTSWNATPQPVGKSRWRFSPPSQWPDSDLVELGADLEPSTVVDAYRRGFFPMGVSEMRAAWLVLAESARHPAARRSARDALDAAEREALRSARGYLLHARDPRLRRSVA